MSETERRGGPYAPPPDDYETFDARDIDQDRRGWMFLGAAAVVFIMFVAVVWNTFQLGVREREDSPVIAADAEPYRVAPEDPGGYQAPDQDLEVTRLREADPDAGADVDGALGAETTGEATGEPTAEPRATREEPVEPPQRDLPDVRVETADADALDADEPAAPDAAETAPATPAQRDAEPAPAAVSDPADQTPESVEPAAPEPERQTPPSAVPAGQADGPYVAQIAAYRSASDAEAGWVSFASRFPQLAAGRAPDIQEANLGDRGVFHRLRIAAFASREDAATFCEALQTRDQACLVARR